MIRNKNKRDLSWFFESKLSSINSLPPYLELYFQLFIDSFSPENELQKRYIFLIWAYFSDHNSSVLTEINNDKIVSEILLKDYDRDNVYYDIKMKNYQYFYYVENEEFFKQNEISINNIVGKRKLLLWFLTYRDDLKNLNFLLKKELEELKEDSKKYVLEGFTISKYFELIIDTKEFLKEDYSASELEAIISFVLFNYKSYKYILTQTQIDELTNGTIYYFINIYKRIYNNDLEVNFLENLDIPPLLINYLKKVIDVKK